MARILVADDDRSLCEAVVMLLSEEGHDVRAVGDGRAALSAFKDDGPWDLVILDVMMPRLDGYEVATCLRQFDKGVPVLMLSSKGDIVDKKSGFRSGADDYVVKPFDVDELLLRVEALLRRGKLVTSLQTHAADVQPHRIVGGGLTVDLTRFEVIVGETPAGLTPKEFQMIALMAQNPDKVFTNEELITGVWGAEYEGAVNIPVYVRRIRLKIEPDPSNPRYLKTVWRFGYQLCLE